MFWSECISRGENKGHKSNQGFMVPFFMGVNCVVHRANLVIQSYRIGVHLP